MVDQRTPAETAHDERYAELIKEGYDLPNMTFDSEDKLIDFCEEHDLMTG